VVAVTTLASQRDRALPAATCLDAFAASGILGIRWALEVPAALASHGLANPNPSGAVVDAVGSSDAHPVVLDVTLNDVDPHCEALARRNCIANNLTLADDSLTASTSGRQHSRMYPSCRYVTITLRPAARSAYPDALLFDGHRHAYTAAWSFS
jgi:tRNA G26 N,N-dimethylase Trm1